MTFKISPTDSVEEAEIQHRNLEVSRNQLGLNENHTISKLGGKKDEMDTKETRPNRGRATSSSVDPEKPVPRKEVLFANPHAATSYGLQPSLTTQPGSPAMGNPPQLGVVASPPPDGVLLRQCYYVTQPQPGKFVVHQQSPSQRVVPYIIADYTCLSILTTFCCFCPVGMLALLCSYKAKKCLQDNLAGEAIYFSHLALIFNVFSVIFSVVLLIIVLSVSKITY